MSRLDELIAELCSEVVEYKKNVKFQICKEELH